MFQTFKQMLSRHFSALNNEATALNERQAIVNSVKGFLMGLFRFVIILGVCYVIVGPVLGIIANSFFSNKDAYNPMVYLIPQNPTLERYQLAIKIMEYVPTMLKSLIYSFGKRQIRQAQGRLDADADPHLLHGGLWLRPVPVPL